VAVLSGTDIDGVTDPRVPDEQIAFRLKRDMLLEFIVNSLADFLLELPI
jgi:hypothetical protein